MTWWRPRLGSPGLTETDLQGGSRSWICFDPPMPQPAAARAWPARGLPAPGPGKCEPPSPPVGGLSAGRDSAHVCSPAEPGHAPATMSAKETAMITTTLELA